MIISEVDLKMANKFINMMMIFLISMIIGTVIASPVDFSTKSFENSLLKTALEFVNANPPNHHVYQSGKLIDVEPVVTENNLPLFKISVLLEPECAKESWCPREICNILIKRNETNDLIVYDQPMKCYYDQNKTNFDHIDGRIKREVVDEDSNVGRIMEEYIRRLFVYEYFVEYPYSRIFLNDATKESITDGTKFTIIYEMAGSTCYNILDIRSCKDDDSSKICTKIVHHPHRSKISLQNVVSSNCKTVNIPVNTSDELVTYSDVNDHIMEEYRKRIFIDEYLAGNPYSHISLNDATKESIPGGTKFIITYEITGSTCYNILDIRSCKDHDSSKICTKIVHHPHRSEISLQNIVSSNCKTLNIPVNTSGEFVTYSDVYDQIINEYISAIHSDISQSRPLDLIKLTNVKKEDIPNGSRLIIDFKIHRFFCQNWGPPLASMTCDTTVNSPTKLCSTVIEHEYESDISLQNVVSSYCGKEYISSNKKILPAVYMLL